MQADQPEHAEEIEAGPWAWPRWMLGEILQLHDLGELATRGLTRRAASILARFLWSTEAIVRRLLLAAAFTLKVAPREARTEPAQRKPDQGRADAKPANADPDAQPPQPKTPFRIFAIRSAAQTSSRTDDFDRALVLRPESGSLPLDPLLRIGAEGAPPRKSAGGRSSRPVRYTLSAEEQERRFCRQKDKLNAAYDLPSRPAASAPQRSAFGQGRSRRRDFEDRPGPLEDPKRRPAGMLARRIAALIRVLEKPEATAQRLAALLARRAGIAARFIGLGPPVYKRSENDRLPRPPGEAEVFEAHGAFTENIPAFDTS